MRLSSSKLPSAAELTRSGFRWLCAAVLLVWTQSADTLSAQVPSLITYQGRIASGPVAFNGIGKFKFALVDGGTTSSKTATASATVVNGFVVSITLLNGGSGYSISPAITITDSTGTGARARVEVTSGSVSRVILESAGVGYSDSPVITIAPPAANVDYTTYWSHDGSGPGGSEPFTSVAVSVSKGLFTVVLGDTSIPNMGALPPSALNHPDVRLRIWFSNGNEPFEQLSPDQRLSSVGYAFFAANVQDGAISDAKLAPNSIAADKLVPALRNRLDGPPSGGVVLSEDPAAANLLATGYARLSGARVVREEWQQYPAETEFRFGSRPVETTRAIWTGTDAILITTMYGSSKIGTRYNPANNTWHDISTNNFPEGMMFDSLQAVWAGDRLLVFSDGPDRLSGGRYNPSTDTWTRMTTNRAPHYSSMEGKWVWNGKELMVFSLGADGLTAASYEPKLDEWTPIPTNGLPPFNGVYFATWTGTEAILLGFSPDGITSTGGRYKPGAPSWSAIPTNGAPALGFSPGLASSIVVWTGTEILAMNTEGSGGFGSWAGRYAPGANRWVEITTNGAPIFSFNHHAVWTGSELLVWNDRSSGPESTSARYRPDADTWLPMNRYEPTLSGMPEETKAIWTGTELLIGFTSQFQNGVAAGSYSPAKNRWSVVHNGVIQLGDPTDTTEPVTLWTGSQVLLFAPANSAPDAGGYVYIYTPLPPLYLYQRQ